MNAKPVLMLSILGNLALASALIWAVKSRPATTAESVAANTVAVTNTAAASREISTEVVTNTTVLGQLFDWRAVESEDYRKYIANLRSVGCPEETIRDIIVADVNKLFENRRKQLVGPVKKFEFWKAGGMMAAAADPDRTAKERALNKEKQALLKELLGASYEEKPDILAGAAGQLEAMFDFLPAEKRSKVFEVMQEMQTKVQKAMKGGMPDGEDMRKLMKESETAMAAILTPEEMLDYNLRFSMTANMMRMQLSGFEPTENEFLDLFAKRKAYDDEFGIAGMGSSNKAEKEKAEAAKKDLEAQVKAMLGPDRYAEYERAQDFSFQSIYRLTEKNDLPKETAVKVYDMKKITEEQAKKIRADTSLDAEARKAALAAIRNETETTLKTVLGPKPAETYLNQNTTYWLKGISPDPK